MENFSKGFLRPYTTGGTTLTAEQQRPLYAIESASAFRWFSYALLLLWMMLFSGKSFGQSFPSQDRCTSKDLELIGASLTGTGCVTCTQGDDITSTLTLAINNTTGSTRTAFAFWGTLTIKHSDGSTETSAISSCVGPVAANTVTYLPYTNPNNGSHTITYKCGDALTLTDLYLAWTDASPNSTCDKLTSHPELIAPKCGTLPSLAITTPLSARTAVSNVTCFGGSNGSINLTVTGGLAPYSYSWSGTGLPPSQTNVEDPTGLPAGTYNVTITDAKKCTTSASATVTQPSAPTPTPAATVVQPTCSTATGTVNVTGPVAGYTYTLTGTNPVRAAVTSSGTFTGVAAGSYSLMATSSAGCASGTSTVTVNPQPSTPMAPTVSLVQPTCTTATGSVNVTSTTAGLSFTLVGTNPVVAAVTNATGAFTGVAPGTYSLTASNGTCTSGGTPVVIMAQPGTPISPTASVVQPTCSTATGSVNVTSATTGLSFTLVGTNPVVAAVTNTSGAFTGVAPGTYNLTASNGTCTSAPRVVTVNPQPSTPGKPAATVVQPTCTVGSGSVTVNPVVMGLSYTLTGTNPARAGITNTDGQFTSVLPGIYSLTASNGTCTSEARSITIDAVPNTPTPPTANLVQPTCSVATGTVTVSSSTSGLSFTLIGTAPARDPVTNNTGVFMGVLPGMYSLTASNGTCTSGGTTITINAQPGTPSAPMVSVTQPTCSVTTGTATVTSATSGLSFTLVGTNPVRDAVTNSTGIFAGLAAGQYSMTASNGTCTSGSTPVTVNEQPGTPGIPMATVTQPTCTVTSGTISVAGAMMGYTYTLLGTNPVRAAITSAGTFNNVAPGQYSLTASNGTCTSGSSPLTVNAVPTNCFAEGCTLGYWKNHTDRWCMNYSTTTLYGSVFVNAPSELQGYTLLQALNLQGGGIYNLARQSTAALLNICSSEVAYTSTYPDVATLKREVNAAYSGNKNGTISSLASALDTYNNAGCPLGGTPATISASSTSSSTLSGDGSLQAKGDKALSIFPNPFAHNASIEFTLAEAQRYSVQVYDVSGRMVLRVAEGMAEAGRAYNFQVVANDMPTGVYMVRLTTAKSVQNHRMIISK